MKLTATMTTKETQQHHQGPTVRAHFLAGGAQWLSVAPIGAQWRKVRLLMGVGREFVADVNKHKASNFIIRYVSIWIEEANTLVHY